MSHPKTKLELTRPGKNKDYRLEPRVLIEKPEYNYGDPKSGNILIHGDNLLALKALEQEFSGKVKCIYIDPPYNTGNAFEHYDDGLEHSEWLSLIKPRLELLKNLLRDDGAIFVSIDSTELAYLIVMMDEIFGRSNFLQIVTIKSASTASFRAINFCPVSTVEYIIIYAKDKSQYSQEMKYVQKNYSEDYGSVIENFDQSVDNWIVKSLDEIIYEQNGIKDWKEAKQKWGEYWKDIRYSMKAKFALDNAYRVVSLNTMQKPSDKIQNIINESKDNKGIVYQIDREGYSPIYVYNGRTLAFLGKKLREIDGSKVLTDVLTNLRDDISYLSLGLEGGVDFKASKKPEKLIKRILEICTNPGDLILDSFLGSGTTAAVAHKMGRKWIGIELGDHAYTHCKVRMDKVIDGEQGGISKTVEWKGGGGYKFYELGPSVMVQDAYGNYIINPEFNSSDLIQSICKIENFTYKAYMDNIKHGYSTEKDFIHVTTRHITQDIINDIVQNSLKQGETILVVAKTFASDLSLPDCVQMKKIPPEILGKCEYGKNDYSLPVTEQQVDDSSEEEIE